MLYNYFIYYLNIFLDLEIVSYLINFSIYLAFFIFLLLTIALTTLLERKMMGSVQRRRGPNVVGFFGYLQPIADGLKLFLKEIIIPTNSNVFLYLVAPVFTLFSSILLWLVIPFNKTVALLDTPHSMLFLLAISSLAVYGIIFSGWASNSKYAFLGGLRSSAQMISYEVCISFVWLVVSLLGESLNLCDIIRKQDESIWFVVPLLPLWIIFFIIVLAETNRAPFDLPEAEAELVAGYNVEYSSIAFALFFLGEYANMALMSSLCTIFFWGGWLQPGIFTFFLSPYIWFGIKVTAHLIGFIWVRATLPRYRYDQLMKLGWKKIMPVTIIFVIISIIGILLIKTVPFNSININIIELCIFVCMCLFIICIILTIYDYFNNNNNNNNKINIYRILRVIQLNWLLLSIVVNLSCFSTYPAQSMLFFIIAMVFILVIQDFGFEVKASDQFLCIWSYYMSFHTLVLSLICFSGSFYGNFSESDKLVFLSSIYFFMCIIIYINANVVKINYYFEIFCVSMIISIILHIVQTIYSFSLSNLFHFFLSFYFVYIIIEFSEYKKTLNNLNRSFFLYSNLKTVNLQFDKYLLWKIEMRYISKFFYEMQGYNGLDKLNFNNSIEECYFILDTIQKYDKFLNINIIKEHEDKEQLIYELILYIILVINVIEKSNKNER
jgi:NADH-quinone oxidoreductase subunit H